MIRTRVALVLLALLATAFVAAPAATASHPACSLLSPATTVTTNRVDVTAPLPSTVGPASTPGATVGGQTVGGQTVGPFTVPPIAAVSGLPVVGTVQVGGQTVGPVVVPTQTLPSHTVPPVTIGPIATGLGPITVTVFGQSATVPLNTACVIAASVHALNEAIDSTNCVFFQLGNGVTGVVNILFGDCDPQLI